MSFRKISLQKWVWLFGLPAGQLPAVLAALEHVQGVQRRIACLIGDSLSIHGGDELFGADAPESAAIHVKDVGVLSIARALRSQFLRCNACDCSQKTVQQLCVLVAMRSLLIQARELRAKDGTLPFAEPVIGTIDEMAIEPLAGHSAAIVDRAGEPFD